MKTTTSVLIFAILFSKVEMAFAQVKTLSNDRPATTSNLGWDTTGVSGPLQIKNDFNQPMNFWTNRTQRATIDSNGLVGIGITPLFKLDVMNTTDTVRILGRPTAITANFLSANLNAFYGIGVVGESKYADSCNIGVSGVAITSTYNPLQNVGVHGKAQRAKYANIGVTAEADWTPPTNTFALKNEGIHAKAEGSNYENRAGTFITEGTTGINYSVWARSTYGVADSGIWGGAPHNYAGYFLGDMFLSGAFINQCGDFMDRDTPIYNIIGALDTLALLNPKSFCYYADSLIGLPRGRQYGFIPDSTLAFARMQRKIYQATDTSGMPVIDSFMSFTYTELIPLLVAGANELKGLVDSAGIGLWQLSTGDVRLQDTTWNVGIGTTSPIAKFHVFNDTLQRGAFISTIRDTTDANIGIFAQAEGSETWNVGGLFAAPRTALGNNLGIIAMGEASSLFLGSGIMFGTLAEISDIELKDSIADLSDALSVLSQLQPKTFVFKRDSFPYLNLPEGQQFGLIAQQADTVVPDLVQNVILPEIKDASDSIIVPLDTFKSIS